MDKHYLTYLFQPKSVVVFVGDDSETSRFSPFAQGLSGNLDAQEFKGALHYLNIFAADTVLELGKLKAELAVIALPHDSIVTGLDMAARVKCKAALVVGTGISSSLAAEINGVARRHGLHLLGPNSLGFQIPALGLNASVIGPMAAPGPLGLISQSGALTASILDWAKQNQVGFSNVVSLGPNSGVDMAQVLDYMASDSRTHSIVIYLEGISHAREFMSALRSAARAKPVVVLKAGRKSAANVAAQTHSGAIVGSDEVFDAALRRAGAVRVRSFVELFSAAKCLASRYRPVGKHLAVITNGGGPGVLAADWISEIHLELGTLSPEAIAALQPLVSPLASLVDLIDLSEEATPEQYRAAIEAANKERCIDGLLVIYSPKLGVDGLAIAQAVVDSKAKIGKPLLCCWMGDSSVIDARELIANSTIPNFRTPEAAVGAFGNIASFYQNQRLLQQTPPPLSNLAQPDVEGARLLIENVLAERRKILTEMESKALLAAFHIPVTQTILATSSNEAMMIATQLGYPVALKIDSPDISHKSDVNGVALNIMNAAGVRDVYNSIIESVSVLAPKARINGVTVQKMARSKRGRELYIGLVTDEPFGPMIAFGAGGTMIELLNDRTMELPPLNQYLAHRLIERSRVAETLGEWRGASAVDIGAIEQILLRVSEMACELPQLREMDINPIIVDEFGAVAVDARIVIDRPTQPVDGQSRIYSHLAILPYPLRYEQTWPMKGGGEYVIRPIHPDDADMLQQLVAGLSPESRYFRFVATISELSPAMLSRFTLIDYDREMALVAVLKERKVNEEGVSIETQRIIGVSRYITNPDVVSCEFSLLVADEFNGKGLGSRLMLSIMDVARDKGLKEIDGLVLANNPGMLKLMTGLGYTVKEFEEDPDFKIVSHSL
jgi:acetyltransferase